MAPYFFSIALLFIGSFLYKKSKTVAWLAIGLLLILSMFRSQSVGVDTLNYMQMDDSYVPTGVKALEVIFLFVSGLKGIFGSYIVIYFFSLINVIFILLACKRFKANPTSAFFFFALFLFFNLSLNIARQFAAASVLLYAYSYLTEKGYEKYRFFLWVMVAIGIHSSSLIALPIYLFKRVNVYRVNKVAIVAFLGLTYILISTIFNAFFVDFVTSLTDAGELDVYSSYFNQAEVIERKNSWGNLLNLGMFVINIYILFRMESLKNLINQSELRIVSMLFFISIILTIFFETVYGNLGRIRYDISIINIVVYSLYFQTTTYKHKELELVVVLIFFGYQYLYSIMNGSYGTVPYAFAF